MAAVGVLPSKTAMLKSLWKPFVASVALLFACGLRAEIHREAHVQCKAANICFYWWPKLPSMAGWQQDKASSYRYRANAQVPVGVNFDDADTVIYARAIYKPRRPKIKNLAQFIASEQKSFLQHHPNFSIQETPPLTSASGLVFRRFTFTPKTSGNWEQVAYSEEQDTQGNAYYLVFVLSARNQKDYKATLSSYQQYIAQYK